MCGKHIDKLASDVGHAGHFRGFTFTEHAVETGIAIRMHPALITRQVLDRVLTLSIHCELRVAPVNIAQRVAYAETGATGQGVSETTDKKAGAEIAAVWDYVKGILNG